jgi:hypothetical protein
MRFNRQKRKKATKKSPACEMTAVACPAIIEADQHEKPSREIFIVKDDLRNSKRAG